LSTFPTTSLTSRDIVAISAPAAHELSEIALAKVNGPGVLCALLIDISTVRRPERLLPSPREGVGAVWAKGSTSPPTRKGSEMIPPAVV